MRDLGRQLLYVSPTVGITPAFLFSAEERECGAEDGVKMVEARNSRRRGFGPAGSDTARALIALAIFKASFGEVVDTLAAQPITSEALKGDLQ